MNAQRQGLVPANSSFTPAPSGLLQRKCACGNHTIGGGECGECSKKKQLGLQTKLKVNEPGDIYEQEADRIADQVMATPAHHAVSGAPPRIQRFSGQSNGQADVAPPSVDQALASPGRPLEPALQQGMEQRFGYDFSRVRVHSDAAAEQSARDVNAQAYTVGHNIVFGAGRFAPGTHEGRRLIAHELTHVVQQSGADGIRVDQSNEKRGLSPISAATPSRLSKGAVHTLHEREADRVADDVLRMDEMRASAHAPIALSTDSDQMIQRVPPDTPEKKEVRKDVVFILSPDVGDEASTLAPGVKPIRVSSLEEMAAALKKIKYPIKNLYIISHALPSGDLGFGTRDTITYVRPSKVAEALQGSVKPVNAPETLDFRGCTIGQDPVAMETMRAAVGAASAVGGNCYLVTQKNGPINLGNKNIRKTSDVSAANRASFEKGLQKLIDSFLPSPKKDCILDKSEMGYFKAGGAMVAQWFSPEFSEEWDERKSRCYTALTAETVVPGKTKEGELDPGVAGHCRMIRIEAKGAKAESK